MNMWLASASLGSLGIAVLHVIAGGRIAARPLLDSDLRFLAKQTHYYCWHLVTLAILAIAAGLGYAAAFADGVDVGWFAVLLAAAFTVWSLALGAMRGGKFVALPQWALFAPVAALGLIGLLNA
ncbi:MAG: hypothetical protein AAFQ35_00885 [Pseudomonadota bacterium]